MAPNFWSSDRFSQCVALVRQNGVQQFAIQLDLDKLPAEHKTHDAFVIEWLASRMLNNYTGNCQTTRAKDRPLTQVERLIGKDVGMGEVIRCKPRDNANSIQVQDVILTSYLINVDIYVDKWIAFEFAEQMNSGLDHCRYNAYPLKPE
ncbi:hypothetical protein X801_01124 [Opisthorchis viverrini]|uniref:Uncharacterized protein n=1 Tax=Opisthorchis viverrini TaxID=6198 RepID=A0A1S8X8D7_OPIVI|nr:hypothetical protein X801_01124 [Opisthorchis viverrini]